MNTSSLRFRVTAWYLGLMGVALVIFSTAVYFGVRTFITQSLARSLVHNSGNITNDYLAHLAEHGDTWFQGEISESFPLNGSHRFVRVSDHGRVLYSTGDMHDPYANTSTLQLPQHPDRPGHVHYLTTSSGMRVMLYAVEYHPAGEPGRTIDVEVAASTESIRHILRILTLILLVACPTLLALAAVGGYLLMKLPLRPIVTLTDQAELIGCKELGERLPVIRSGDELERLSLSLNRMIDRLEEALSHNQRFSADASHELRTPLTILQGELEELLEREDLPASAFDGIASALEEIERMARIVNSLMAITRLDAGGERMEMVPMDFATQIGTTVDHMRLLAEEKEITLTCKVQGPLVVLGDAMRLKQVLVNLVDNAVKYTPEGGSVHITAHPEGQSAVLEVADTGIGIPAVSLPFLFDRFYRADKARSRESGGVGLGLSIVKSICGGHEGTVTVRSTEGVGTTFRVCLPLTRQPVAERPRPALPHTREAQADVVRV